MFGFLLGRNIYRSKLNLKLLKKYLESALLRVQRELVEAHGTDEGYVGGLTVQHL